MQFWKKCLSTLLMIFVISGFLFSPADALSANTADISKITVTFWGDPGKSRGFTWYTDSTSTGSDLQIVKSTNAAPDFSKAKTYKGRSMASTNAPGEYVHKAEANGLKPATVYYYRVGDAALNRWSKTGTFKTAARKGGFTFIDLADTQAKNEQEAALASQTIAKALTTVKNSNFLALNGDLVDLGTNEKQWDWLLGHTQNSLLQTTILPLAGNHEDEANSFIEHFNLKVPAGSATATGAYYSLDYQNAHLVVLNTNEDSSQYSNFSEDQIKWMQEDIKKAKAKNARWILVFIHKGPYTTSNHATNKDIMGPNGVRTKVVPLLSELGVDFVFQGHDHIYARTKPIKNGAAVPAKKITQTLNGNQIEYFVNPDGAIYYIPSTAGAKVYSKNKKMEDLTPGYYDLFEVADEHHAAIYGPDPKRPDRPKRGLIQNFASVTVDNNRLTVVSYEIDQNKPGATPYVIDQFGIIKDE